MNIISITVRMTHWIYPIIKSTTSSAIQQRRLWVVTVNGTSLYTDKDNFQNIPLDFPNKNGIQILENKDGKIFLKT